MLMQAFQISPGNHHMMESSNADGYELMTLAIYWGDVYQHLVFSSHEQRMMICVSFKCG